MTDSGREQTDKIGGDRVTISMGSTAEAVSHEFGHVGGGGDEYPDGIGANGKPVTKAGPGFNVMQDLRGPANAQTFKEMLTAPTNKVHCAIGVSIPGGGC